MRESHLSIGLLSLALVACQGGSGEDTGEGPVYETGCITSSSGGSFAFLADAARASSEGATVTLCPGAVPETVEISGKSLTIVGTAQTTWEPPANQAALILSEGADVTVESVTVLTTRNGFETTGSTLTVTDVLFDQPANYAVEGSDSAVTLSNVEIDTPGWGGVSLSGAEAVLTADAMSVLSSTGNAVTLEQGASGVIQKSDFTTTLCTNDGTNCLEQDGWAIEITDGGTLTLSDNTLSDNLLGGVRAESATVSSTRDAFIGNYIGMWLENATATLDASSITGTMQYGILGLTLELDMTDVELSADPVLGLFEEVDDDTDGDGIPDENATLDGTYGLVGFDTHVTGTRVEVAGHNGGGIYLSTRLDTSVSMELNDSLIDNNAGWGVFSQLGDLTFNDVTVSNTRNHDEFCIDASVNRCNGGVWAVVTDVTWTGGAITGNESMGMVGLLNNHVLTDLTISDNRDVGFRGQETSLTLSASTVSGESNYAVSLTGGSVATIDDVDFQNRSYVTHYDWSDGSSLDSHYGAYELFVTDTALEVTNSRFQDGERGVYVGSGSTLALEDSSFVRYNRNIVYVSQGDATVARTTFEDVGSNSWYCISGSLTSQDSSIATVRPYESLDIDTDVDGVETRRESTRAAPAIYASNCDLDLSSLTVTDSDERAISSTNGAVQLDGVSVAGSGASSSATVGAIQLTWSSAAPDGLLNDVTVTGVTNGDAIRVSGSSATTTGSVRLSNVQLGADDGLGHAGVAEAGVRASFLPDVRITGLQIEGTVGSGLAFSQSTATVDGTALASAGTIVAPGQHGVEASGGSLDLVNLTVDTPAEHGLHVVGTSVSTTGFTVTDSALSGMYIDGGTGHSLATTTVTGAGTYGMECVSAPQFSTCESTLSVAGTTAVHLGCDDCATLAGF